MLVGEVPRLGVGHGNVGGEHRAAVAGQREAQRGLILGAGGKRQYVVLLYRVAHIEFDNSATAGAPNVCPVVLDSAVGELSGIIPIYIAPVGHRHVYRSCGLCLDTAACKADEEKHDKCQ